MLYSHNYFSITILTYAGLIIVSRHTGLVESDAGYLNCLFAQVLPFIKSFVTCYHMKYHVQQQFLISFRPRNYMYINSHQDALRKKATIHQVTTMHATSKKFLFPGHNHLLTTGTDDLTLIIARVPTRVIIKVLGHKYLWLADGYDL